MVELIIGNSYSQITGLSVDQIRQLRELMSYRVDTYNGLHRYRSIPLITKTGVFPTGLLYLVESWIAEGGYTVQVKDTRICPITHPNAHSNSLNPTKIPTPYPEQMEAAEAVKRHKRGIVVAPTGTGKSLMIALTVDAIKVPTLVVVPTLELKAQLTSSLKQWFGDTLVGPLTETGLVNRWITVENVDALDPKKVLPIDAVIIDEFHHAAAKTYHKLNKMAWKNVFYRIGMTATPFRADDNERLLLESVLAEVIYKLDYRAAVEKGYIVPIEAYFFDLPKRRYRGTTWSEVYSEAVVNNEERNTIIADILASLNKEGKPTLCLVKEIAHGEKLKKLSGGCAFVNGQDEASRIYLLEYILGDRKALIGTVGVLGEGVDTKPAEYVIIAGLGKSKNQFMQMVGRGFRTSPGKKSCKIIIFRDVSHRWTKQHFAAQVKYLKEEYGVTPERLEVYE